MTMTTSDTAARKLPKWFKPSNWFEATVDLTDYDAGTVTLRDPTIRQRMRADADGKGHEFQSVRGYACYLRLHVVSGLPSGAPTAEDPIEKWEAYVEAMPSKVASRILDGIAYFVSDPQPADVPNS